jgi:Tfp pilus assembly protein PilX
MSRARVGPRAARCRLLAPLALLCAIVAPASIDAQSHAAASTPYGGTLRTLPGTVQAEDFDDGGSGVAYHDNTPGNAGGAYRATDVDIAAAADTGGGYTLGWVSAGEWLNYTVQVGAAGTYDIEVRVASAGAGGTFRIEVDGVDRTGPMTVPDTGGWQNWTTIRRAGVTLGAGRQVWRLVMTSNGATNAVGNFNWFRVTAAPSGEPGPTPFGGTPRALPGTVEAEDFDEGGAGVAYHDNTPGNAGGAYRATDVDIAAAADTGGGYTLGWVSAGEWLNYTVQVGAAGTYDIEVRVASAGPGGTFRIEVDGVDRTGPLTVPDTGGWQSWTTIRRAGVALGAGRQVWRLVMASNGPTSAVGNINWIRVTPSPGGVPASTPFGGTPRPLPGTVQAEDFDDGGPGVAYHDNTPGNAGGAYRVTDVDIAAANDTGGGYTLGWVSAGEWLNYTVQVSTTGTYDIEVRVASAGSGGTFRIEVDGVDRTGPLAVPNTGGWQNWTTIRRSGVTLGAGVQVWRLVMIGNGATSAVGNINWIRVLPGASGQVLLREPYLQQVTDRSAVVVWTTNQPGTGEVSYRQAGGALLRAVAHQRWFPATYTGLGHDYYQHEAWLTGLAPATEYTYGIATGGLELTAGQDTFRTAPPIGEGTVRFIAFGDSGVGSTAQRELATRMTADTFDLAIHSGDVAYGSRDMVGGGTHTSFDAWVFGVYAPWFRTRPFFPSIGNHDDEIAFAQPYRDVFVLPENGASPTFPDHAERFYSFDYGPIHFIALDSELAFIDPVRRQAQLAWLEADLAATRQPWRVAYFHRPPYSAGFRHGSDLAIRQAFVPIFERYGVQLVITGHEHLYERTIPWREFVQGGSQVTYVVTGGGGATLYQAGTAAWTAVSRSVHHYVRATADSCTLRGEAVAIDGSVFDTFTINRCAGTPPGQDGHDVVLYPTDVSLMSGNWSRVPSTSGAGNLKMASEDRGWASPDTPLAAPADYFEASFDAPAGTYAVWLRLRATADSKFNDSVWVQFSDAVDGTGAPLWRIGSSGALLVNLEDCHGCGVSGWGWQDNAWWLGEQAVVRFTAGGRRTIRIQTREDGVEIDQIVLSPARFFSSPPGSLRDDRTIVPKP